MKKIISKVDRMLELAQRSKAVNITPSKVLGCNPTMLAATKEQLDCWEAAIVAAERKAS